MRRAVFFLSILAGVSSAASLPDIRSVVERRANAVVKVETFEHYLPGMVRRLARLANPFPLRRTLGDALSLALFVPSAAILPLRKRLGSGVIIDPEGHVLTNNHVVRSADEFTLRLRDSRGVWRKFEGSLLATDPHTDIALLKFEPGKVPIVWAPIGDSDKLATGDWVIAIGHPINLTGTVTCGVVSGLHRQLRANLIEDYIQIDAAINPGNSGGPVLNIRGEIVGIVALGLFPANNLGFAVPTSLFAPHLDEMRRGRRPRRGYLGVNIRDVTPELVEERELVVARGVYVSRVAFFAPAGKAGLRKGDVIIAVNGRPVTKAREVQRAVLRTRPGQPLGLTVRRGDKEIALEARPALRRTPLRIF